MKVPDTTPLPRGPRPSAATVAAVLAAVFVDEPKGVELVERVTSIYESTFGSEIVTCRFANGTRRVFLKYGAPQHASVSPAGHRGGLVREAAVYDSLLDRLPVRTPQLFGSVRLADGRACLVLEYLEGAHRLQHSSDLKAYERAARWLGEFHAAAALKLRPALWPGRLAGGSTIPTYDLEYYTSWAARTREAQAQLCGQNMWLSELCDRSSDAMAPLVEQPRTLIHGEFYPSNILCHGTDVCPVDWETAAMAPGEIDLAMLTSGWIGPERDNLENAYIAARWPEPGCDQVSRLPHVLAAARIYECLRWLGDAHEREFKVRIDVLDVLRVAGRAVGVLA